MAKFDLMWFAGLIGGWYASQYVYNHYVAPTVQGLEAMLLTEPSYSQDYMSGRFQGGK